MIKKKILFSRIKIALDLSKEYKTELLEIEHEREIRGLSQTPHTSFIIRYIDEIIGILEGQR